MQDNARIFRTFSLVLSKSNSLSEPPFITDRPLTLWNLYHIKKNSKRIDISWWSVQSRKSLDHTINGHFHYFGSRQRKWPLVHVQIIIAQPKALTGRELDCAHKLVLNYRAPLVGGSVPPCCVLLRYLNFAIWNEAWINDRVPAIHWGQVGKYQLYLVRPFLLYSSPTLDMHYQKEEEVIFVKCTLSNFCLSCSVNSPFRWNLVASMRWSMGKI